MLFSRERQSAWVIRGAWVMPSCPRWVCPCGQRRYRAVQSPLPGLYCTSTTRPMGEWSTVLRGVAAAHHGHRHPEQPQPSDDCSRRRWPLEERETEKRAACGGHQGCWPSVAASRPLRPLEAASYAGGQRQRLWWCVRERTGRGCAHWCEPDQDERIATTREGGV
jgi:hypothetical protein